MALLLASGMAMSLMAGCGSKSAPAASGAPEQKAPEEVVATEPSAIEAAAAKFNRNEDGSYSGPLTDTPTTLSMFCGNGTGNFTVSTFSYDVIDNNPALQKIFDNTNVKIDFVIPTTGEEVSQFNLMIASGNYSDIIIGNAATQYPGGMDQAIDDGVFMDLTPYLESHLPNYYKKISANDAIWKEATTLQNRVAACYYIYNPEFPEKELEWWGSAIRKDILDDLGLEVPTTMDEWETVLLAMKDAGVEVPYSMLTTTGMNADFLAAYGIPMAPYTWQSKLGIFAKEDGSVTYGAIEPGYKDYLTTMNRWYHEGLLDPEFMTRAWMQDRDTIYAMYGAGKIGAAYQLDGILPTMVATSQDENPKAETVAVPVPKNVYTGETSAVSINKLYINGHWFAITSACKDPELAMAFLDYLCSDEGVMLTAFGIEGETYTMENGSPKFTDVVMECPSGSSDGMRLNTACALGIQGMEVVRNPMFKSPEINEWDRVWTESVQEYQTIYDLTADEETDVAAIMSDISTFTQEQTIKAIIDDAALANWDNTVEQIKGMGMDDALAIYQAGYDRYNLR